MPLIILSTGKVVVLLNLNSINIRWEIDEIGGAQALVEFTSSHLPRENSSDYPTIWVGCQKNAEQ